MLPFADRLPRVWLVALLLGLTALPVAKAQDRRTLRLDAFAAGGARSSVTEAWGTFEFAVTNFDDRDRTVRVLFFYDGQPDIQYGREVVVPARSRLATWLLGGPAPAQGRAHARSVQMLLYDRTDGQERLILPRGEERIRTRDTTYLKREPYTAIVADDEEVPGDGHGELPRPATPNEEVMHLVRTARTLSALPPSAPVVLGQLPATPEAFDGIDQLVLASNRLADDPPAQRAVRRWLQGGGTLWVMLDRVAPETVAPLLGDALDFTVIDRGSLVKFQVDGPAGRPGSSATMLEHDRPVDFVRVLTPADEQPRFTLDGWPVWLVRTVGRGKVVLTTLAPRGWVRFRPPGSRPARPPARLPRRGQGVPPADEPAPPSPIEPLEHLYAVAGQVFGEKDVTAGRVDPFRTPLLDSIGYSIVRRETVALVFGAFVVALVGTAVVLRGARGRQSAALAAPVLAILAGGTFLTLGERSRRAAAPTVAYGQWVDAAPGLDDAAARGLVAVYRAEGGPAPLGAEQGGLFEIDPAGLDGQTRRFLLDDLDTWRWDGLSLPAGVRTATFRHTVAATKPVRAVARLTPTGLEGRLEAEPFRGVSDAVLLTPGDRPLAVPLGANGTFRLTGANALAPDQYLAGTLVTDRQRRRQDLYRQFLTKPPAYLGNRTLLLAWADPIDPGFQLNPGARTVGDALLVVPLGVQPAAPDTALTIPASLVSYRRVHDNGSRPLTREAHQPADQELRFQLPVSALPMRVERVRLAVRIEASGRRVTVAARDGQAYTEVHRVDGPRDTLRVEIADPRLLTLDERGGLYLRLAIGERSRERGTATDDPWVIRSVELEVTGRTLPE